MRTLLGTELETNIKHDTRIALMIRWLEHNEAKIRQFEYGAIELNFAGNKVTGKLVKATLDKPET